MKRLLISLLTVIGSAQAAELCSSPVQQELLLAQYELTASGHDASHAHRLLYARHQGNYIWRNPAQQQSQLWYQTAKHQVGHVRYFDDAKRAIEYQPGEVSLSEAQWQQSINLYPEPQLANLTLIETLSGACGTEQHYQNSDQTLSLVWLPQLKLVKSMEQRQGDTFRHWQLQALSSQPQALTALSQELKSYYATDFADIGDNEADPFLAKLIHLGFVPHGHSGAYDSDGTPLELEHHSH